jgi:predicted nucleotidyltransferase
VSEELALAAATPAGLVVSALRGRIDANRPPMLIGAEARDILHAELGHTFSNQATQDVDLAFAIPDWSAYATLVEGLEVIPDTGIAFRVAGMHVDLIAFGPVESPSGTVTPPFRRSDPLDVFGMTQVYESARSATFGDNLWIRLPTVPGYAALKIKAWIDRSADYNEKDAPDIGLVLYWAAESTSFTDRFWANLDLVGKWEADVGLGGAAIMGEDVRQVVGADAGDYLADLLTNDSRDRLARALESVRHDLGLGDVARRRSLLDAMTGGLRARPQDAPADMAARLAE